MKSENEFNALLGRLLRKFEPTFYKLKVAEKYHKGISDFFIWTDGGCAALEVKFVKKMPVRDTTLLLAHPFDGSQLTFLNNIAKANNPAFGLIGFDETKEMLLMHHSMIPRSGNWTLGEFREWREREFVVSNIGFTADSVQDMLAEIFYGENW